MNHAIPPSFPQRHLPRCAPALAIPILLMLGALVGTLPARATSVANTPATPVPQDRWGTPPLMEPQAILCDATSYTTAAINTQLRCGNTVETEYFQLPTLFLDAAVSGDYLFTATGNGVMVHDLAADPSDPPRRGAADITTALPRVFLADPKSYIFYISVPAADSNVGVTGGGAEGTVIWNFSNKSAPSVYYQDYVPAHGGTNSYAVWAGKIGGRDYAFVANNQNGVNIFDMTAAEKYSGCDYASGGCGDVWVGRVPISGSYAKGVGGAGSYLAVAEFGDGFEIWNVANPRTPVKVLAGNPGMAVANATLWQQGAKYYLATLARGAVTVWDVSCIATASCGSSALATPVATLSVNNQAVNQLTLSQDQGRSYLYAGSLNYTSGGNQREFLWDVTDPAHAVELTPPDNPNVTDGGPTGYWGWYYAGNYVSGKPWGFTGVGPNSAVVHGGYLYRAARTILDVHQLLGLAPPVADFTWSPLQVYPGQAVTFKDLSSGAPTAWSWTFSGTANPSITSSTAPSPQLSFGAVGTATVKLTATNSAGPGNTVTKQVAVLDPTPKVTTVTPSLTSVYQCQPVIFTASATGEPTLNYSWQVENSDHVALADPAAPAQPYGFPTTPTAGATSYTWDTTNVPQTGVTYYGHVFVTNGAGSSDMRSVAVTVNPLDPLPNDGFTLPSSTCTNCTAVAALGPPAGVVEVSAPAETGVTAWRWNFGDGTGWTPWSSNTATGPNTSHTYTAIGNYNIQLQVENCKTGPATSASLSVAIQNLITLKAAFAPTAGVTGYNYVSGAKISFTDSSTGPPTSWYYDWTNTQNDVTKCSFGGAAYGSPQTSHTYTVSSSTTYYPCLKVVNGSQSDVALAGHSVTVGPASTTPPPTPSPSISIGGATSTTVGTPITLTAFASSCTPAAGGWSWSVGGGTISGSSSGSSVSVSWATSGTMSVSATNSGCSGAIGYKSVSVTSSTGGGGGGGGAGDCGAVSDASLQACFTYTPAAPSSGSGVTFDASGSAGSPTGFSWTFGDGSSGSGVSPQHTYSKGGTYTVHLTVSKFVSGSSCGFGSGVCGATESQTVTVAGGSTPPSSGPQALVSTAPAATLLLPYWEVDLGTASGRTTLFAVTNTANTPRLARVTLWTDWGVPTLSFDVYLSGFATQTLNLRDLLHGNLPVTGPVTSSRDYSSNPEVHFAGCPGTSSNLQDLTLPSVSPTTLQAEHLGQSATLSSQTNMCAASSQTDPSLAVGYATIDVVNECSSKLPTDSGYFADGGTGVASDENVLVGDYFLVDPGNDSAQGDALVAIQADPSTFTSGTDTFYSRLDGGDGSDNREPLPSRYASRYLAGGAFTGGTDLLVWRDLGQGAGSSPISCSAAPPSWSPLPDSSLEILNEAGQQSFTGSLGTLDSATQRVKVGTTDVPTQSPFGRLVLGVGDGGTTNAVTNGTPDESWATTVFTANGRYSVGLPAAPLNGPGVDAATRQACDFNGGPAATLLIPYFEVDLTSSNGPTTLFAFTNVDSVGHLAKVTLWTNWAVPTLSFNVYVAPDAVKTFNVRDLFNSQLSQAGPASGDTSLSTDVLAACVDSSGNMVEPSENLADLKALHTGLQSPVSGKCAGSVDVDNPSLAVGYITIDVVNKCSTENPSDAGYFAVGGTGVASDDNVLVGDFFYVDSDQNYAQGDAAVSVHATPGAFASGDYTFYGRYVGGSAADDREPLGETYSARYLSGGAFSGGTDLIVWRDTKSPAASAVSCGSQPSWGPLSEAMTATFDEAGHVASGQLGTQHFPWATQMVKVDGSEFPLPAASGRLTTDLGFTSDLFGSQDQGWVLPVFSAEGQYSITLPAQMLKQLCSASAAGAQ